MKIAFVGKGGSGKTTLSSLFVRHLGAAQLPVLAVDADINQHLAVALGFSEEKAAAIPPLGGHLELIKDYLRGTNPRIRSADEMVKTTPPGRGSRLLRLDEDNPVYDACRRPVGSCCSGVRIMATGPFQEGDLGVSCYHSKVGAVELLLNHLVDDRDEYIVVDMTAGSDAFASGLFTRFDMTFLVAEPTRKGVSVYRQYRDYARDWGVALAVVGNKVQGPDDLAFLREHVGADLLTWVGQSEFVREVEKGRTPDFAALEPDNTAALERMREAVDATFENRDWARYTEQMIEFHVKNAHSWANARAGVDLTAQVDPEFVLGPAALEAEGAAAPRG